MVRKREWRYHAVKPSHVIWPRSQLFSNCEWIISCTWFFITVWRSWSHYKSISVSTRAVIRYTPFAQCMRPSFAVKTIHIVYSCGHKKRSSRMRDELLLVCLSIRYSNVHVPCLESREYGCRDPSRWPRGALYMQNLAITSPLTLAH
jgi:hypothetical protein